MKTNKAVLIFLLITIAVFQVLAKEGEGEDETGNKDGKQGAAQDGGENTIDARLRSLESGMADLERENALLQAENDRLRKENENLRKEVNDLTSNSTGGPGAYGNLPYVPSPQTEIQTGQTRDDKQSGGQPQTGSDSGFLVLKVALGILILVLLGLLIACIISLYRHLKGAGKERGDFLGEKRGGRQDSNSSFRRQSGALNPESSSWSGAGKTGGVFAQMESPDKNEADRTRWGRPVDVPPVQKPPADEISPLYHSREKRDKRRDSDPGDIFLDVSKSVFERLAQGEKVQLAFEKGGTRLSARFVLVNNKLLYPNFHIYNETKELSRDNEKVLSMIYSLEGKGLPGFVERCSPAVVSPRGDTFVIAQKGSLETGL
jgi:hypothetical protein